MVFGFKRSEESLDSRILNVSKNALFIQPKQSVFIIYDFSKENIARTFAAACEEIGAEISICQIKQRDGTTEPPKPVAMAMKSSDIVIDVTANSMIYTNAVSEALKTGARVVSMPGINEKMLSALDVDYEELSSLCKNFQKKLDNAKEISIKTQSGTDLSFRCKERKGLINDGTLKEKCTLCNLPAGEAGISVTENSADGNLVIDVSLSDIELKNPVKMKLVKGEISQIEGYEEANILKSVFEKQNKTARILSGFSLGLNKKAITIGNALNDGKVLGNCRIAFGDNVNIGGKNKSDIHIDAVLKSPTIHIDGDEVMKDGMLKSK